MRAVIFGVDGLTFRILHPLMERGDLPNFRRLAQEGCEAVLESKYPPLTPPAWISLSTGLKPARHGVYDFWEYEEQQEHGSARNARVQTHRKGGKAIWNILSDYGKRVLVINVPSTYPPDIINGIMVSGYMTPSSEVDFTYPTSFKQELYQAVPGYEIDLDLRSIFKGKLSERTDRLVDATLLMTQQRIALTMYLLKEKPWDLCYVVFVGPDRLQHLLWNEVSGLDERTNQYFQLLDHALGLILEQLGPDDCLFVVSDHGFQGISRSFDINEYLLSKGLLKLGADNQHNRRDHTANLKHGLKGALSKVGLLSLARRAKRALKSAGMLKKPYVDLHQPLLTNFDWERTVAHAPSYSGFGGAYADIFLSKDLSPESIIELCADLKRQTDPKTGKPLIDAIYTTEVFGSGPYAPPEPHLLLLPTDGITFRMSLGNRRLWDDAMVANDPRKKCGSHQKDGVLYAYGRNFKRGYTAPKAEIYDLVPTVLRSMGLPLPHVFDGRMLDELFVESEQDEQVPDAAGKESSLARRKLKNLLEV